MATTPEIDAAILKLRTVRLKFAQKGEERGRAILARDTAVSDVTRVTNEFLALRDEVTAAKDELQALLTEPEL